MYREKIYYVHAVEFPTLPEMSTNYCDPAHPVANTINVIRI